MQDAYRNQALPRSVDEYISPSNSIAAALAAAQSSTTHAPYPEMSAPYSAPIHSHYPIPASNAIIRPTDDPSLGLKHDFMVMPGINMEAALPSISHRDHLLPPREHGIPSIPWTGPAPPVAVSLPNGAPATSRDPYFMRASPGATTSSLTHLPPPYRPMAPIEGGASTNRKPTTAPAAGPIGTRKKSIRKKPRGPARFACPLVGCGKAFRMQGDLQTHMRLHTGEEPFECSFPFCGRRYKWRSSLSHHEGLHLRKKGVLPPRRSRRAKNGDDTTAAGPIAIGEVPRHAERAPHMAPRRQ